MHHNEAPVVHTLVDDHAQDPYGFSPPSRRQGRGSGKRPVDVLGLPDPEDASA